MKPRTYTLERYQGAPNALSDNWNELEQSPVEANGFYDAAATGLGRKYVKEIWPDQLDECLIRGIPVIKVCCTDPVGVSFFV